MLSKIETIYGKQKIAKKSLLIKRKPVVAENALTKSLEILGNKMAC